MAATSPILHPATAVQLEAMIKGLPQGLLLTGESGVGLTTISRWIAGVDTAGFLQPKNAKGEIDQTGTISVDAIRQLYTDTRSRQTLRQICIIDNADKMSAGAQAAFLKLLEEPNEHTHFILTSHHPNRLAKTIHSRLQTVVIQPISDVQTVELMRQLGVTDQTKRVQLQYIAKGKPAEITRLLANEDYFNSYAKIVTDARMFIQATPYEKLIVIQRYQADRTLSLRLIDSCIMILRQTLRSNPEKNIADQMGKLLDIHENIAAQHNIRLQLMGFVV